MSKRIVLCCDGTWNTAGQRCPTNVITFHDRVAGRGSDGVEQLALYHSGVGTSAWQRLAGGAFGFGLSQIVRAAYRFLVECYEPGDELFLLGFSRGAFTARSTAGLIRNAGILRRDQIRRVDDAYALYRNHQPVDAPDAVQFRRDFAVSETTPIRFIGVWDTVGSLGVPDLGLPGTHWLNRRWQFHDVRLSASVQSAYHALAIDETRRPFLPTLWTPDGDVPGQHVEQVWFSGVHCDVGGGYPERQLADITLAWMIQKASECGLAFTGTPDAIPASDVAGTLHDSRTGIYKLTRPAHRTLGATDAQHEAVSSTAVARHEHGDYAPTCLTSYLSGPAHHECAITTAEPRTVKR